MRRLVQVVWFAIPLADYLPLHARASLTLLERVPLGGVNFDSVALQNQSGLSYDGNDRMNHTAASGGSYDENGNARYHHGYTPQANAVQIVSSAAKPDQYDFDSRLLKRENATTTVSLVYDGDGNRIKKTVGAVETHYLIDGRNPTGYAQVLEESTSAAGTPAVKYVIGLDILNQERAGAVHYFGYDGLGSVRFLTDSSGTVTDIYTHDAFGLHLASTGETETSFRFADEYWDQHLGMSYNRGRYYHPDLGRFWTRDSYEGDQANPLSLHAYVYAEGDPVRQVDPSGNLAEQPLLSSALAVSVRPALTIGATQARRLAVRKISESIAATGILALSILDLGEVRDDDEHIPTMYYSRADFPIIADNIATAQSEGKPVLLHYLNDTHAQDRNRYWAYKRFKRCAKSGHS